MRFDACAGSTTFLVRVQYWWRSGDRDILVRVTTLGGPVVTATCKKLTYRLDKSEICHSVCVLRFCDTPAIALCIGPLSFRPFPEYLFECLTAYLKVNQPFRALL